MSEIIDPSLAKNLITEYRNQNAQAGDNAWKTPNGQNLNGFYVERSCLESILSDQANTGMHIYFAKHPDFAGSADNVYTVTLTGAKPNPDPNASSPYINDGDVFDNMRPCPPACGDC